MIKVAVEPISKYDIYHQSISLLSPFLIAHQNLKEFETKPKQKNQTPTIKKHTKH